MKQYLAKRVTSGKKIKGLFEIYGLALAREREGKRIIHMEIGRPDFDTPQLIKDSAAEALKDGLVYYTEPSGLLSLRQAIVDNTKKRLGLDYGVNQVITTIGASEALDLIWRAFLEPDDEIMLPSPYYGAYTFQLDYLDKKYVKVPILKEDGQVRYDIEDFRSRLTPHTKMILLNSPNNPTGYVMTREEVQMIADFAVENDLIVVSDECYDHYVFEGEHVSIATLPGMQDRTLLVNSTSKTFAMTGWRVGYVMGHPDFIDALVRIHGQSCVCPTSFAQAGSAAAYANEIPEVQDMLVQFRERKEYIADFLQKMEGVSYVEPKGAFYVFMDVSALGMPGADFCEQLIEEQGVTLSPGNNFGLEWDSYVRISYACSLDDIKEAMDKLKCFIDSRLKK